MALSYSLRSNLIRSESRLPLLTSSDQTLGGRLLRVVERSSHLVSGSRCKVTESTFNDPCPSSALSGVGNVSEVMVIRRQIVGA